jgi:hypothetical protein
MSNLKAQHQTPQSSTSVSDALADQMRRMAGGFATTQILHAAAQLGIVDHLGGDLRSAEDLATVLDADSTALYRFMRMMVVLDLLVQAPDGRFGVTSLGALLVSDHPEGLRDRILYIAAINYPTSQAIGYSVQTGKPAFDQVFGLPFFDHLASHPVSGARFNRLMQENVLQRAVGIMNAYDFSAAATIIDIGGGNGTLISAILDRAPQARGVMFDMPGVIEETRRSGSLKHDAGRLKLIEGDLFSGPFPAGGDIYVLSNIIHDWDDDAANTIFMHSRRAMHAGSRLLLIEEIMPESVSMSPSTVANDFSMLLLTGGKERTESEYRVLLSSSGFSLRRTIPFSVSSRDTRRAGNWAILECLPTSIPTCS